MFAALLTLPLVQDMNVTYDQFAGLHVKLRGVPFLVGSSFNYYDAKSGKSLYSSRWAPKEVGRLPDGSIRVRYSGDNGNAIGTHTYTQTLTGLTVRYEFRWRGSQEVRVDNCIAQIWAPVVCHGEVALGGSPLASLMKPMRGDWPERRLGAGFEMNFDAPLALVGFRIRGANAALYDARGYGQDWAKGNCLFWLGRHGLAVHPGETTEMTVDWAIQTRYFAQSNDLNAKFTGAPSSDVLSSRDAPSTVIPKPKSIELDGSFVVVQSGEGHERTRFAELVASRWRVAPEDIDFKVESKIVVMDLSAEGFEIVVDRSGATIRARDRCRYLFHQEKSSEIIISFFSK